MILFYIWLAIGVMNIITWEVQENNSWVIGKIELPILKTQYFLVWIVLLIQLLKNYGG